MKPSYQMETYSQGNNRSIETFRLEQSWILSSRNVENFYLPETILSFYFFYVCLFLLLRETHWNWKLSYSRTDEYCPAPAAAPVSDSELTPGCGPNRTGKHGLYREAWLAEWSCERGDLQTREWGRPGRVSPEREREREREISSPWL